MVGAVMVVVTTTGGRLDFVYVALNPFEVRLLSDLKRTTIVLLLISSGFGMVPPHNLPVMDYTSVTRRYTYAALCKNDSFDISSCYVLLEK